MKKDIFTSYKNDGEGNNFAARLEYSLSKAGYSVYFNPNEQHAGSFPERLRTAVENCSDFYAAELISRRSPAFFCLNIILLTSFFLTLIIQSL